MQKKLIARTAKLHSEPRKGRRFKGIAITYEHIPTDLAERNHGSIYAVLNVNAPAEEAEDIAELIIETFSGEFYQNLNEPALTSFESALAKINEELAEATHQGHINWLNNLNGVLAVLSNNVLHITQSGKAEAYLYRGEKSSHISDDLAGDSVNPLRTFINIASGELHEGDKVAIVTPSVFFHISKDELKRYVQEFQPKVAISHIADLLEGTSSEMNPNAALIIETVTPEVAANETLDEQPDEVWISQSSKPVEDALDTAAPIMKKVFMVIAAAWTTSAAFVAEKIFPFVKEVGSHGGEVVKNIRKSKPERTRHDILVETEESLNAFEENFQSSAQEDSVVITAPKLKTRNEIFIKEDHVKPKWLKLEKVNFSSAKKVGQKLQNFGGKYTKNRKNLAVVGTIVFLLLLGGIAVMWQQKNAANNLKLATAALTEAQSKYEIGKNEIAEGNRSSAVTNLNSAKSIAANYTKNNKLKDQANDLLSQINTALDEAENVTRPDITEVASVSEIAGTDSIGPISVGKNLYFINKSNGQIAAVNTTNNEVSNVLSEPKIDGKMVAATAVTARNVMVLVTDKDSFYEFDTKENKLTKQSLAEDPENITAIASFSTNIYTLSNDGKVYKRLKTNGGYGKRSEYITDGNYPDKATDLKIDSNLYVLNSEGAITKYLSGKKQNFAIYDLPNIIDSSSNFYTDEDLENIFITNSSSNRIVMTDKKGKFVKQFASDKFAQINGTYSSDGVIYVNTNGKILKFNY